MMLLISTLAVKGKKFEGETRRRSLSVLPLSKISSSMSSLSPKSIVAS